MTLSFLSIDFLHKNGRINIEKFTLMGCDMQQADYRGYTIQTIENYPVKYRRHLQSLLIGAGFLQKGSQESIFSPDAIDISELELNEQIIQCIDNETEEISNGSLGVFEKWEYTKDYKYSVLFSAENYETLVNTVKERTAPYDTASSDFSASSPLFSKLESPQFFDENELKITLLKFNRKFEAIHPQTGNELFIRYPIVVAFHHNEQLIEIRFDALKRFFMDDSSNFYARLVEDVQAYLQDNYGENIAPFDLDYLISKLRNDDGDACLIAQSMRMANGSYAELKVEKNEELVLPFIGELKNFLIDYNSEFEKVPVLRDAFEQFIFEKEATSDYPWIELLWKHEMKTRSIHVKVTYNYCQKGYCLLQHYFNSALIGMERMNNVVRYISETAKGNPKPVA